jgi:hypothetical protein
MKASSIWVLTLRLAALVAMAMAFSKPAYAEYPTCASYVSEMEGLVSEQKHNQENFAANSWDYGYTKRIRDRDTEIILRSRFINQEVQRGNCVNQSEQVNHGSSPSSSGSSGNSYTPAPPSFDHVAALKDLQNMLNHIGLFTTFVAQGRDFYGCKNAQLTAVEYEQAKAMAHTYLEKTTQPEAQRARINIMQIDLNTVRAAKDRDEFYCAVKPPASSTPPVAPKVAQTPSARYLDYRPAQQAFFTFAAEMHLESGLPTMLSRARASALYTSCFTDDLNTFIAKGSYTGKIIGSGCSAMILPFFNTGISPCTLVQNGVKLLASFGSEPSSDPDMQRTLQIYFQLKTAFKCPNVAVTYSPSGIMTIDSVDYIIVKPYPNRPVKTP